MRWPHSLEVGLCVLKKSSLSCPRVVLVDDQQRAVVFSSAWSQAWQWRRVSCRGRSHCCLNHSSDHWSISAAAGHWREGCRRCYCCFAQTLIQRAEAISIAVEAYRSSYSYAIFSFHMYVLLYLKNIHLLWSFVHYLTISSLRDSSPRNESLITVYLNL